MARRGRTSPLEDLLEVATLLPYWVSLIIAVVSYVFFHSYAEADLEPIIQAGRAVPENLTSMMFQGFSKGLQYVVPGVFVLGAIGSGVKNLKARTLASRYERWSAPAATKTVPSPRPAQSFSKTPKPTDDMSWSEFELLVGEAFRKKGFSVVHGGDAGADGGVDVHLRKDGKRYLVQCKHWKTKRVGVAVIRELYGVMASSGVAGGYVVTSGEFTEEAKTFAEGKPLMLIDGDGLGKSFGRDAVVKPEKRSYNVGVTSVIHCPKCNAPMVKRKAKRGPNAGNEFWGCSKFPKCRGILDI